MFHLMPFVAGLVIGGMAVKLLTKDKTTPKPSPAPSVARPQPASHEGPVADQPVKNEDDGGQSL